MLQFAEGLTGRQAADALGFEVGCADSQIAGRLADHAGYRAIQAIPGVGPVLAAVFVAEIGDVTRFTRPARLCSWAGLTARHRESDTTIRRGRITKQGSKLVRWAAIEAIQRAPAGADGIRAVKDRIVERRGELLALRWTDLDLNAGTAVIRRTLQRTGHDGLVLFPAKTDASERRIALPTTSIQQLRAHRSRQQTGYESAEAAWSAQEYVFTGRPGQPVEPSTPNRRFTTLLTHAGLRRIRFHDLRHSATTLLLDEGVELVVIKELLGHAHIGVTSAVYAHVRLRLQREAIDRLGSALNDPSQRRPACREASGNRESGILDG